MVIVIVCACVCVWGGGGGGTPAPPKEFQSPYNSLPRTMKWTGQ